MTGIIGLAARLGAAAAGTVGVTKFVRRCRQLGVDQAVDEVLGTAGILAEKGGAWAEKQWQKVKEGSRNILGAVSETLASATAEQRRSFSKDIIARVNARTKALRGEISAAREEVSSLSSQLRTLIQKVEDTGEVNDQLTKARVKLARLEQHLEAQQNLKRLTLRLVKEGGGI